MGSRVIAIVVYATLSDHCFFPSRNGPQGAHTALMTVNNIIPIPMEVEVIIVHSHIHTTVAIYRAKAPANDRLTLFTDAFTTASPRPTLIH